MFADVEPGNDRDPKPVHSDAAGLSCQVCEADGWTECQLRVV
jgi:hypothetical protein